VVLVVEVEQTLTSTTLEERETLPLHLLPQTQTLHKEIMGVIVTLQLFLIMALEVVVEHQQQVELVLIPQEEVVALELLQVFQDRR
jgi:hypothetical protein